SQSGTYTLTVTDITNGCNSSDEVVVTDDFELPVANPGSDQLINCFQPNATLDGSASSAGAEFTYEWLLGGSVVGDAINLPVSQSGTYTLTVFNTVNGCESSATVFVQE